METKDTASCFAKLSVNSVRRCYSYAPLGFVSPSALGRGLSVKSLSLGGGPVFAVRLRVLLISHQVTLLVFLVTFVFRDYFILSLLGCGVWGVGYGC